jgi:uncharacterized Zn finger protein (UPF0148 family)
VQNAGARRIRPEKQADPDIFFNCEHCKAPLVVNRSAAGMRLSCQRCGKPTLIPKPSEPTRDASAELHEIQRKLKENESQRTEVSSHINQVSIQLHRWQLRLQALNERKTQLEKELGSLNS